uniref:Uncharacterized protein n=1 Tax=viral metagenome TaxID=1070528 RepID=A0A6M3L752_9ZZZZ
MDEDLDTDFDKTMSQFSNTLGGIMQPLCKYGQEDYVIMVIPEIQSLAYQLHLKLCGIDEPYQLSQHTKHMIG